MICLQREAANANNSRRFALFAGLLCGCRVEQKPLTLKSIGISNGRS